MALVRRDPFARTELHRDRDYRGTGCMWCGQTRKTPNGHPYVFAYSTASDGGRRFPHRGRFCSTSCHDSYHG